MTIERKGPLRGIRVPELPNIGPLQHAGMILADLGAEVRRLERKTHVEAGTGLQGPYTPFSLAPLGRRHDRRIRRRGLSSGEIAALQEAGVIA